MVACAHHCVVVKVADGGLMAVGAFITCLFCDGDHFHDAVAMD